MKKLVLLSMFAALSLSAYAQEGTGELRDLKLMIRNQKGKVMKNLPVTVFLSGDSKAQQIDRFGNRVFRVAETDTLNLLLGNEIYSIPVAGMDSVYVALKNRRQLAGTPRWNGKNETLVDTGYGTFSRKEMAASAEVLNMENVSGYTDLRSYMIGRVAGVQFGSSGNPIIRGTNSFYSAIDPLVIVDGTPVQSFSAANDMLNVNDIKSVSVLKDAGTTAIYGSRGANGVIVITTKSGERK